MLLFLLADVSLMTNFPSYNFELQELSALVHSCRGVFSFSYFEVRIIFVCDNLLLALPELFVVGHYCNKVFMNMFALCSLFVLVFRTDRKFKSSVIKSTDVSTSKLLLVGYRFVCKASS